MWSPQKYFEWKNNRHWYDLRVIKSHNAFINFVVGMRNSGKTYSLKVECVHRFLKYGEQFIWVRRKVTEMKKAKVGFFDAIKNNKFLMREYGDIKYTERGQDFFINGKKAGEIVALVQHQDYKSVEYPYVKNIVFDEFIVVGSRRTYLPSEAEVFNDFILSVKRHKKGVRVYLLGNSVRFNNPYMNYYKIRPFANGIRHYKRIGVLVQMYVNKYMIIKMINSDYGRLIEDTDYFEFAVLNKWRDAGQKFISKRPKDSDFLCAIRFEGSYFSFYIDRKNDLIHTIRGGIEDKRFVYVISTEEHDIDYQFIKNMNRTRLRRVFNYYTDGRLRFNNESIREQVVLFLTYR